MNGIILLLISVALWGLVHSLLASNTVKGRLGAGRMYRLAYNLFAALSFLPILYLMLTLPDRPFYTVLPPWSYVMRAMQILGTLMLLAAFLQTDSLSFVGLRQLLEDEKAQPARLVTGGLYKIVRHPLYTAGLMMIWFSPSVSLNTFVVYASATVYLLIGALFEERKLLAEFGQAYAEYRGATPMLIPFLKLK